MKKRFTALMTMVMTVGTICMAGTALADVETHDGTTMSGTVPFAASWDLTEPDVTPFTTAALIAAYDADGIVVSDLIAITDFDCNTKYKITATKGTWTLPTNYPTTGVKKADGSDSDLLLMVDNITAGYVTAGMAAIGAYGAFTAITTDGSDILGGGLTGAGVGHGVENAVADVNAKILMDWSTDIVGAYSITTTLTITEVTE